MMTVFTKELRVEEKEIQPKLFERIFYLHRDRRASNPDGKPDDILEDIRANATLLPLVEYPKKDEMEKKAYQKRRRSINCTNRRRNKILDSAFKEVATTLRNSICV